MEIGSVLGLLEKYLREFILYLLHFFTKDRETGDLQELNQAVLFAVLAAFMGCFLWNRVVYMDLEGHLAIFGPALDKLLEWLCLGLAAFVLFKIARLPVRMIDAVILTARVLSVSFVLSTLFAFMVVTFGPQILPSIGATSAAYFAYGFFVLMTNVYLVREATQLGKTADGVSKPGGSASLARRVVPALAVCVILDAMSIARLTVNSFCNPEQPADRSEHAQSDWRQERDKLGKIDMCRRARREQAMIVALDAEKSGKEAAGSK